MFDTAHYETSSFCVELTVATDAVLYVNVESPVVPVTQPLRDCLVRAIQQHQLSSGAPSAIAAEITACLQRAAELPEWVFYSAILASAQRVEVCVAGPHRVHLIEAGHLTASTREHILRHDDAPPDWPELARDEIDLELQGDIVTRSLGKAASQSPETTLWMPNAPYRIVSCSSDAFGSQSPTAYANSLSSASDLAAWSGGSGSVFVLERR